MVNLELKVAQTTAGVYTVTFAYKEAPLDVQETAFAVHGLYMVSPAQLGFLRASQPEGVTTFNGYSRTNAYVFYDARDQGRVVVVPGGAISHHVGVDNIVAAHRRNEEYAIPDDQRDTVYDLVDTLLKRGTAFVVPHGETRVQTSGFGRNDLTARLFSDKALGINAQGYGDWLQSQGRSEQVLYFDTKEYVQSQKCPYVNRLRVYGPDLNFFSVSGYYRNLDWGVGAFGVRFETSGIPSSAVKKK